MSKLWQLVAIFGSVAVTLPAIGQAGVGSASAPAPPPSESLVDVGGHRLHFEVWPGSGPYSVVFEAGGGGDASSWGEVPRRLAGRVGARGVAYDRAGLGGSELGPLELTPEQEVTDLDRALDELRVGPIVLVGHSFGGLLSLYHAAVDPARVRGLVLVDPMNPGFVAEVGIEWLQGTVPDVVDPQSDREHVMVRMKRTFSELVAHTAERLPEVGVPMTVLTAGEPWLPTEEIVGAWRRSHEALVDGGPRRKLVVAARSKHDIPATEPDLVVGAVEEMLRSLDLPAREVSPPATSGR
jgi:pimeloyl-ACP methyl ester carboxylesterase